MSNLWRTGGATVAEVKHAIDEPLAYTSAASALQTLEDKGYVTRTLLIKLTVDRTGFGMALPAFSCTLSHLERRLIAMTPKKLRHQLVRVLSTCALASLALLAACKAKLPTNEEVSDMPPAFNISNPKYYVDDVETPKAQAEAIKPESIVTVNINKKSDGTGAVRITTLKNGATPRGPRMVIPADSTAAAPFSGLLIVDGVARDLSFLDTLKPDQIASINVIKGPAAAAKYSFQPRAVAGVIEIVTKKPARP